MLVNMLQKLGLPRGIVSAQGRLGIQASWIVGPFAIQQIARLATNIILARMLAPEMFGLMLIVNTLRTGVELLSDIGIGQSVVRAKREPDSSFLNTAWTLQFIRGAILTALVLLLARPVAGVYDPDLEPIIFVVSAIFIISGLQSPALFMMQRRMLLKRRALLDVLCTVLQCVFTIALAYVIPSVWALVWGLVLSVITSTLLGYIIGGGPIPRFSLNKSDALEVVHFGKWIFLATAIYFAATSFDKAYLAAALPLAIVGVYSVARTFSDMTALLTQRLGAFLVFPKIAGLRGQHHAAAGRIRGSRRLALALAAFAVGIGVAASDALIILLYDPRYHAAAFMLPVLLIGTWFAVLANFAESMLLGCDRPAPGALANASKFVILAVGLPLSLSFTGLLGALMVLALAESCRWLVLGRALVREKLSFFADDLVLTALLVGTAGVTKLGLGAAGIVPDFAEWWAMGSGMHG